MTDSQEIDIGSVIGGFKIEKELGRGGMGVVYRAHELSLNRKIALKILSERLSNDKEFIERFKREARVVAALNHPNIVNILSYGEEQGLYYFAMEYVKGTDLGKILKEKKEIPLDQALSITTQIADALEEAAARGVVHRDLKPSNIMIDSMGRIKVTDFGIAYFQDAESQLTRTGLYMGTPEFSSPEQARGAPLDVRSDIFSLGAILYKMLSGTPPVSGESPLAVVAKILTEPIIPISRIKPTLPHLVAELVDKMMAKDIEARFQTPTEVMAAISDCLKNLKEETPLTKSILLKKNSSPPPVPPKNNKAKNIGIIVGVILAILLSMWSIDAFFLQEKPTTNSMESMAKKDNKIAMVQPGSASLTESENKTPEPEVKKEPAVASPDSAEKPVNKISEKAPPQKTETKITRLPSPPPLPKTPKILLIVSGDENLVPFVRANLESVIVNSGLKASSVTEIPILREKMQMGHMPITRHEVQRYVPKGQAQILLLAEVRETGSMPLNYYGRTQTLTSASFSVRAIDIETGTSAASPGMATAKFTPINLDKEMKRAVNSAAGEMGESIKKYWRQKINKTAKN